MKSLFSILVLSIVLISCNSKSHESPKTKSVRLDMPHAESQDKIVVNANQSATLEVEGMVCKMGCAAAIKGELLKTNAVAKCSVDFEEERKINTVNVQFDSEKIDSSQMKKLIETINDGQFTVHTVDVKSL